MSAFTCKEIGMASITTASDLEIRPNRQGRMRNRPLSPTNTAHGLEQFSKHGIDGLLCARDAAHRTPLEPASQLTASFIVHGDYHVRDLLQIPVHDHPSFELNLVTSGSWTCFLRGVECELAEGDAILAQPGELHHDRVRAGTRYRGLRFALHRGWREHQLLLRSGLPPKLHRLLGVGELLLPILDRLQSAHDPDHEASGLVQDAILLEMVWRLAGRFPTEALHPQLCVLSGQRRRRRELLDCFEQYHTAPIGIQAMARSQGISLRTFQDRCWECFNMPPSHAFMVYRLEHARRLLQQQAGASIREISQSLGFGSPFHFSRCYKEAFGTTPSRDR
jgi:AraC-like DNA-binding protein